GQHPHPVALANWKYRRLDPASKDRVRRLLRPKAPEGSALGNVLRLDDVLRRKGRAAERSDLPLMHEVAQYRERLLDVGGVVSAVDLVEVDPVGIEAPQALLDFFEDPAPRVATAVAALAHLEVHLRGEYDVVPVATKCLTDDLFGLTLGVHVGGVDEVDALVKGGVDDTGTVVMVGVTDRAEHHGAEAMDAHPNTGAAKNAITHGRAP